MRDVEEMFRVVVFNVLSHNRDDHSKKFSFLMDDIGAWRASPAYDLTFSSGPNGHQSTMVMGEGKSPNLHNLKALGQDAKIDKRKIDDIISQTQDALSAWRHLAGEHGVSRVNIALINEKINLDV